MYPLSALGERPRGENGIRGLHRQPLVHRLAPSTGSRKVVAGSEDLCDRPQRRRARQPDSPAPETTTSKQACLNLPGQSRSPKSPHLLRAPPRWTLPKARVPPRSDDFSKSLRPRSADKLNSWINQSENRWDGFLPVGTTGNPLKRDYLKSMQYSKLYAPGVSTNRDGGRLYDFNKTNLEEKVSHFVDRECNSKAKLLSLADRQKLDTFNYDTSSSGAAT